MENPTPTLPKPPAPPPFSPNPTPIYPPTTINPKPAPAIPPIKPNPPSATIAVQKSPFRFLIPILAISIIVLIIIAVVSKLLPNKSLSNNSSTNNSKGTNNKITQITYWGLWEPSIVMQNLLTKFETDNPDIKVNYQQQSIKEYRERLQNSLKNDQGPDLFRFHLTWTPLLTTDLSPIPASVISPKDFETQQYPVAQNWLKSSKGYLGLPLMYEGLALFYNQTTLESAGKTIPKTWADLKKLAIELSIPDKKSGQNRLLRGGLALGTTTNVDNWSDILGWLIIQNSGNPAKPNNNLGQDALTFYTSFVKPARATEQTWDENLPGSTVAFATEKAVMIIAPSWRALEIKDMNPNLKFASAPLPQFPEENVTWSSIWVEGVSSHSDKTKQSAAFKLLAYLNQKDTLRNWFAEASRQRLFGEPFARTDMADQLTNDPLLGTFIKQAPYAQSWFMSSRTFDNGPNDKIIKYYEDGINAMVTKGDTAAKVTPTIEQGVAQIITQYRLPAVKN